MTARRHGTARASPLSMVSNNHLFSGLENDLVLSRVYTTSFACEFHMEYYPFDQQICTMIFVMRVRNTA